MVHENCTTAHIHWMENTGVQKLTYPCLKIEDATVTAENGASKDVTMKLSSMVVDELGSVDYEQALVFDTAKMNELTDGDIAFGFVKKLHIFFSMNVTEELVDGVGKSKFDAFQAIMDGFQLQFDEQTTKNEANQEKFDAFQAIMDGFQMRMDNIEQKEIVALKQKDFDQQVQIEGLLKVVFDLHQEVIHLKESHENHLIEFGALMTSNTVGGGDDDDLGDDCDPGLSGLPGLDPSADLGDDCDQGLPGLPDGL